VDLVVAELAVVVVVREAAVPSSPQRIRPGALPPVDPPPALACAADRDISIEIS